MWFLKGLLGLALLFLFVRFGVWGLIGRSANDWMKKK